MAYVCPYYGHCIMWSGPQYTYPLYYYSSTPAWPYYSCCAHKCYCACCCHCACACARPKEKEAAAPTPISGKIQVQGKMELKSTPEDMEKVRETNRRRDEKETPRSWRRVSSLPRLRAELPSRDYSDDYYSPRRHRGRRDRYDSSDGLCEGTFTIKGFPRPERREPRRRAEPARNIDRDCKLKGTLTFNTE